MPEQHNDEFRPTPKIRPKGEILDKLNHFHECHVSCAPQGSSDARLNELLDSLKSPDAPRDFVLGVFYGLLYAVSLDPETIEAKRIEHEAKLDEQNRRTE